MKQGNKCNLGSANQVYSRKNYLSKSSQVGREVAIGQASILLLWICQAWDGPGTTNMMAASIFQDHS